MKNKKNASMTCIQQLALTTALILYLTSCRETKIHKHQELNVKNAHQEFATYCQRVNGPEFETSAVESSFFGDYRRALELATKRYHSPLGVTLNSGDSTELIRRLKVMLADSATISEDKKRAGKIREFLNWGKNMESLFEKMELNDARTLIVKAAHNFHFLLINEAHYSTQNRIFTESLLEPLWTAGYRYLALETLNTNDSLLTRRGYPTIETGFYTRDPSFANMVRKAMALGYKLVPYETTQNVNGTARDRDQADNILNATYRKDQYGKVLVHAGYSHISEKGDHAYRPMGEQLREMYGADILTVDQETMTELTDHEKENPYYTFAEDKYQLKEPGVLVLQGVVFVDPIHREGIDIQVFHPRTEFVNDRPVWLLRDNFKTFPVYSEIKDHQGHLLQAFKRDEPLDALPIDQVIVGEKTTFILPGGEYVVRAIDCSGTLTSQWHMTIPK